MVAQPGGWLDVRNMSVAKKVYIGTAGAGVAALIVYGAITGRGDFNAHGDVTGYNITATGSMKTEDSLSASGVLSVDGLAYLNGGATVTGNLNTTGNTAASGTLSIDGNVYLNDLVTESGSLVNNNLTVKKVMSGTSLVIGTSATFNGLAYSMPATDSAGTVLTNDGAGNLTWDSLTTLSLAQSDARYVNVAGDTMTGGLVLQEGTLTGSGVLSTGALSASGTLSIDGDAYLNDLLTASGATVTNNLRVGGAMSGASLRLNGFGSGTILCGKTDGSIGKCSAAVYGAGVCICE